MWPLGVDMGTCVTAFGLEKAVVDRARAQPLVRTGALTPLATRRPHILS